MILAPTWRELVEKRLSFRFEVNVASCYAACACCAAYCCLHRLSCSPQGPHSWIRIQFGGSGGVVMKQALPPSMWSNCATDPVASATAWQNTWNLLMWLPRVVGVAGYSVRRHCGVSARMPVPCLVPRVRRIFRQRPALRGLGGSSPAFFKEHAPGFRPDMPSML